MKQLLQWVEITQEIIDSLLQDKQYQIRLVNDSELFVSGGSIRVHVPNKHIKEILLPIKQEIVITDKMIDIEANKYESCMEEIGFAGGARWMRDRMTQQPKQGEEKCCGRCIKGFDTCIHDAEEHY